MIQQPQQEYIITEDQIKTICDIIEMQHKNSERMKEILRSRPLPHTSSTEAPKRKSSVVEDITFEGAAIVQAARREERNATLDDVKKYADTCIWIGDDCCPGKMNEKEESDCDGCSYVDYPNNADICEKIESLRTPTTNQQERKE